MDTRGGGWQIATRRTRRGDWLHPFDPLWWQGAEDTIEIGTIDEIEALFTHPHLGIRQIVATHPMVWRDVRDGKRRVARGSCCRAAQLTARARPDRAEIVDFAATVRSAGFNQRQEFDGLAVAGHGIPGIGVLNDAAETLGLERKPSRPENNRPSCAAPAAPIDTRHIRNNCFFFDR